MASAKNHAVESANEPVKEASAKPVESIYSAEELIENHSVFRVAREIVVVALKKANKEFATYAEAKEIIDNFKNRRIG